ncbi:glycoside hydrolase family 17 protein [Xylariaceae sp. FL1651]|nr:glycoside hydrolase family 17 protein [Xylariaceae sp. FL1651]
MKATMAVAALAAGASAGSIHHRHNHIAAHAKKGYEAEESCGCTTVYSTYYGSPTLIYPSVPASAPASSSTAAPAPTTTSSTPVLVPTPIAQTCPTTGVYTFPATTVTLTESTTVPVPYTTSVPAGTHTIGGVTTVVTTATTVVCPYATVSTSNGVTTSVIESTTYVCPSAGTYTIAPTTTTVTEATTVTVPTVTTYAPGTYTQPEVVTTIYETSTVVYCPFEIPTPSTTDVVVEATTTSKAVPTTYVVETTPAPPSSGPSKTPSQGTPGKPWAVSYTPYESSASGGCKTQSQVDSDIAAIAAAGVTTIRVYSTDCNTLEYVGGACEAHGIKMILGIYVDEPGCDASSTSVAEQVSAIKAWAKWDIVSLISVGNEAVLNGFCTPSQLAGLISTTKQQLSFTGPYSCAETVNIWQQEEFSSVVCPVVDFVGANAHAFFNTETTADQAGEFVKGQLNIIDSICNGKEGRIMETGWPYRGQALGMAVPGVSQQASAIKSIVQEVGDKAVLFSLTSDAWKDGNTQCQCEQYWGCASVLGINI